MQLPQLLRADRRGADLADDDAGGVIGEHGGGLQAGAGVTSYNDTGLAAGSTYTYRVRATNGAGDSAPSDEATATTSWFAFKDDVVVRVSPAGAGVAPIAVYTTAPARQTQMRSLRIYPP